MWKMILKERTKPSELQILELLDKRMNLDKENKRYFLNLKKGYEGELIFDSLTEKLQCECLILNGLLFEVNNTTFQIDSLIIVQGKILSFEIKNMDGDYYYENDRLYKIPKFEISNPLVQLSRSDTLLRQLLKSHGYNYPLESNVVFINQNFTLYQAPLNKPIILPTQVKQYLGNLNATPSKLSKNHSKLANLLISLHQTKSPYEKLPQYKYELLQKGITCMQCDSFSIVVEKRTCRCTVCGYTELSSKAILRTIEEFKILFPNEKLTTNTVYDWCKIIPSKKRIRTVLANNFKIIGEQQWTYYE